MRRELTIVAGTKYGRLTVIEQTGRDKNHKKLYLCRCECGEEKVFIGSRLKSGHTKSCGCLSRDTVIARSTKHSLSRTRAAASWANMMYRCYDPQEAYYHRYGARGIKVCERWHDLKNFFEDMGERPEGQTLERINNDGDYEPGNCKWASPLEQSQNTSFNRQLTFNGLTLCLSEWARRAGIKRNTIEGRLDRGWSIEQALTIPPGGKRS